MASNNPHIPYVRDGILHRHDGTVICAVMTEAAQRTGWRDWLEDERHKSFHFVANNGAHLTAIKEKRTGSSGTVHWYWFGHRSIGNKKRRVSLGKAEKVTLAKLSQVATRLAQLELISEDDRIAGWNR